MLIRVDWQLRRVWILRWRIHHWMTGGVLVIVGGWMVWDDRRDLRGLRARN